jgi:hypothetical protein
MKDLKHSVGSMKDIKKHYKSNGLLEVIYLMAKVFFKVHLCSTTCIGNFFQKKKKRNEFCTQTDFLWIL